MNAKNTTIRIALALFLTLMAVADVKAAGTATFQRGVNSYDSCHDVVLDANWPNFNYGRMGGDLIGSDAKEANLLMRWSDLSIPTGQKVAAARIKIFIVYCNASHANNEEMRVSAYEVSSANKDWQVGNGAGELQDGKVCWNYKGYHATSPNPWAGGMNGCEGIGDHADTAEDMVALHDENDSMVDEVMYAVDAWHTWDISPKLVQESWIDTPADNAGLLFDAVFYDEGVPGGSFDGRCDFNCSDESSYPANRPILEIDYALPGDASRDNLVDGADFNVLLTNWGTGDTWAEADFNYDLTVDGSDFNDILTNWTAGGIAGVPEPATMALLLIGLPLFVTRRRKR